MTDLTLLHNGELMVTQVQAETVEGVDFVDAYIGPEDMTVVDSGRILVPQREVPALLQAAKRTGLSWEEETQ